MKLERQTLTREEQWERYWPEAVEAIQGGRVVWVQSLPGFRWSDGVHFGKRASDDFHLLCVLWTAMAEGLIRVNGSMVLLTIKGREQSPPRVVPTCHGDAAPRGHEPKRDETWTRARSSRAQVSPWSTPSRVW